MITKQDVLNLAKLARIEMSDEEAEKFTPEIDSILGFVGKISSEIGDVQKRLPELHNVFREDVVTNLEGQYTDDLLNIAPSRQGNYLKVKKIL